MRVCPCLAKWFDFREAAGRYSGAPFSFASFFWARKRKGLVRLHAFSYKDQTAFAYETLRHQKILTPKR